ncbi:MAG: site-specific integrase [Vicinamibacterales bacterium]|nr:site-specific integrase [Vicinamibacterales bacterium]
MTRHRNGGLKKRCGCPRRTWAKCPHPWHFGYYNNGREHRYSLSQIARVLGDTVPTSKTEAKTLADRLRAEIRAGRDPSARLVPPNASALTFGDVCDRYLDEYVGKLDTPDGPRWSGQYLRSRTAEIALYHIGIIRRIAVPASYGTTFLLEAKTFADVSTADIKTVQAARRSHGLVGCNRLMARLRHLFNWSIAEGLTERSPFTRGGVSLVKLDHRAEAERTRRLQPGERDRLLQHANPHLHALIIAALSTGCRRGELLSLQWSQIRRDEHGVARWIEFPASKTKTHEPRVIPVSSDLRAVLEMRRTDPTGEEFSPDAYVFGNAVGERRVTIKTAWRNTCRRAGIRDLHFHDLRREFACRLLESSADLHDVRDFLGHANITTTSRYLRSAPMRLAQALERMEVSAAEPDDADERLQRAAVR